MSQSPTALIALTLYAIWTMLLVLSIATVRVHRAVTQGADAVKEPLRDPAPVWRLHRAHMNAIENLPIFATVVLAGWAAGAADGTFNVLAVMVVAARAIQSVIHIGSESAQAVPARFLAFAVQIVCEFWMAWLILAATGVFPSAS